MERLTYRLNDQCDNPTDSIILMPYLRYEDPETRKKILNRLATYEDTGLEPEEIKKHEAAYNECLTAHHTAEDVIMMIKTAPTVSAVPVVRCGECKKKDKKECPMTIINFGRNGKEILVQNDVPDDFYCAYGERKEGAD